MLTVLYLTMDSGGTLYVLDRYEPFVRLFDHQGGILRAFGEAGQGPGELGVDVQVEYLPGIAIYPRSDGSILVHEAIPPTLTVFNANGEFIEELRLEGPIMVPRGTAAGASVARLFMLSFSPGEASRVDRFDLAGRASADAKTVLLLPDAFPPAEGEPPWPATPLSMAPTPNGGFALADPWRYIIRLFGPEGDLEKQIERDVERPPKSAAALQEQRQILHQRAARSGDEAEEPHPEASHFPRGALDFDDAGRLWVATNRGAEGETLFDLFTPAGTYLGEVALPAKMEAGVGTLRAYAVAGEHLAAVVVEDSGNHRIGVWHVVWP